MNNRINIKSFVLISIPAIFLGVVCFVIWSNDKLSIAEIIGFDQKNLTFEESPKNAIALGQPCNMNELKSYNFGGNIENTKGLQCYGFDDLSNQMLNEAKWIHPNKTSGGAIWIYPNHMNMPAFIDGFSPSLFDAVSLDGLTQYWETYNSNIGNFSFKFPKQWTVATDKLSSHTFTIENIANPYIHDYVRWATIRYYPDTDFESTFDYLSIKEVPDSRLIPDNSNDTFVTVRHFNLNENEAILVSRMSNYDVGVSSYNQTIYVIKPNSYLKINYEKYNSMQSDLPIEMLIKTLSFN